MGKQQETDEFGIPIKKTSTEVDEFGIPIKKKNSSVTVPSASTSTVTPTTAPLVSEGGTSGLGITPSGSQGIPSLPGRVNPQTLAPINKPIQQVPEPAVATQQKPIAQTPAGEYKPELYTVDPNKANMGKNDLGENLTVGQKDLGTISTYSGQSLGGQTTGFTQGVIANKEEATDLKGKSDYFNKVYAPIAKQKGLALNSDGATMDFYLNYLKDTNPAEYKYNLDKFNSLREAVEEGKNTKNYAGDTKEDQLDLERFEAELITKGTKLKTEAYSGFKRETKATIDNFYKDKVDKFSALSSEGEKKISEVNSVIAELDKFPKNENGEIITDATNRKQVEQLIEKQQKLVGELEGIQGGIGELKNDKDFNDAYALMQDADARQEEVSKRYYDLATSNPEAFKNLPEYKALLEGKAAAKKKKDYQESIGATSFGVNEGIGQAVTNFVSKLAYIPKSLGSDEYGITDRIYDSASQNIQDFNDEYITTPTEMDKPLLEDGKWSLKYLPGKLAGTATDMALMILTTKGIGGATGALPLVSEGAASAIGQVASGYVMSADGYYKEAKQSGMSEADANSIAREVAILDGFLELVSPNEKLLSPFKLKDDFASYAEALAKGATKKKALAETTRKIIEKNIPENIQELLQTTNAHVMFTSNELSKANESARQSFGEEVVETVIMTTLLTSLMGGKESVTTRNRYNNEALYMAAFAPDKMMSTMSKNLERGLITQEQFDKLSQKVTIASEALKKMGDVPQEKKIKTLPAMVEKMEEEAKKKETDTQFQAPIDEKIKTKEEEIKQVLNEPSEVEMLDENIAYLQELDKEGIIDDNQKEELNNLLTQKQKTNVQEEKGQAEVLTEPVEETAPYVVDATEQRQPIELSVETPKVEAPASVVKEEVKPTPKAETPTKKEEAKPEVKAVELEPRIPGGLPRKMEFKDGEWKLLSGDEYTRVAPAVQQQAQEAFDGIKTEVKKEEVKPVEKPKELPIVPIDNKSDNKETINEDELTLVSDIINSSKLKEEEKAQLLKQYKKGVMSLEDIKNYSGVISSERLASGKLNKWDRAALYEDKQKNKKNKSSKDYVDFEEVDTDKKEVPQSNKETVVKPTKVEKVAEEKPIESNKKEDIIDKEEEAAVEADKSVKEDEEFISQVETRNIALLKEEKDPKMIEQRAVTALAKIYIGWKGKDGKDKKITYSTYTKLKNKIEDIVEGKISKQKLEGRVDLEIVTQKLNDIKKRVKEKLLGEGYDPSKFYSAPGINPKVISDLIDATFNLAEKAIRAGFTIKEAVDKANKLIKSNPAYKAAVRNKQIDEKEFESKVTESVNEETEALKKAFEEEQKKRAKVEEKPIATEEQIKTGKKKTRKGYTRQEESKKYNEIYSEIPPFEKEYEEVSNINIAKFVNSTLDKIESVPNGLVDLANDMLAKNKKFSDPVNIPMMMGIAERLYLLSKDSSSSDLAKNAAKKLAGKLISESRMMETSLGQSLSALQITAKLISSSEDISMANIEYALKKMYEERVSKKEKENIKDVANELADINDNAEIRKQIKEELMAEYSEKLFGKDKAKEIADAFDSMLIDLKDC